MSVPSCRRGTSVIERPSVNAPAGGAGLWVFGYGSLMWRPGFDHTAAERARLEGWHRAPCVLSHVHRGTPERPGVVLGLDEGGSCEGLAYHVPEAGRVRTLRYLRDREQVTMVYREQVLPVRLADGRTVEAVTYTVDRLHEQYARALPLHELLERIEGASGRSGANPDYFRETARRMHELGIRDDLVARIAERLGRANPPSQPFKPGLGA